MVRGDTESFLDKINTILIDMAVEEFSLTLKSKTFCSQIFKPASA
jgi:hypothetical protein